MILLVATPSGNRCVDYVGEFDYESLADYFENQSRVFDGGLVAVLPDEYPAGTCFIFNWIARKTCSYEDRFTFGSFLTYIDKKLETEKLIASAIKDTLRRHPQCVTLTITGVQAF